MNERVQSDQLVSALEGVLAKVPSVERVRRTRAARKDGRNFDGALELKMKEGARQRWVLVVKAQPLEPFAAGLLALRARELIQGGSGEYVVALSPYVSDRSAEILVQAGAGYLDLSGNCRLVSGSLFIERTGFPNAFARKASLGSLFTPGAERVLRALLDPDHQRRTWTIRDLAAAAFPGVSVGQAHRVVKLLEAQAFLHRSEDGLVLKDADKLLGEWAKAYRFERSRPTRYYSPMRVPELQERLVMVSGRVGKTTKGVLASFSAAEVLAPHVRQHRFFAYWRGDRAKLLEALELKPADSGENVVILEPYDEGVFYPSRGGAVPVTGPVQTYLDLNASPARGKEAAGAVFDKYLREAYAS